MHACEVYVRSTWACAPGYQDHHLELLAMLIMNASPYPRGADVESVYIADLVLCYVDGPTCHLTA